MVADTSSTTGNMRSKSSFFGPYPSYIQEGINRAVKHKVICKRATSPCALMFAGNVYMKKNS